MPPACTELSAGPPPACMLPPWQARARNARGDSPPPHRHWKQAGSTLGSAVRRADTLPISTELNSKPPISQKPVDCSFQCLGCLSPLGSVSSDSHFCVAFACVRVPVWACMRITSCSRKLYNSWRWIWCFICSSACCSISRCPALPSLPV